MTKLEALQKAADIWKQMTGTDLEQEFGRIDFRFYKAKDEIREAVTLDESGVTTMLIMDHYAQDFARNLQFTVDDLINRPESVYEWVNNVKTMREVLHQTDLVAERDGFIQRLNDALKHSGCLTKEVLELMKDHEELGFIRRDALRAIKTELEIHQFHHGEPSKESPKFNSGIYQVINVNSLLALMANTPISGITLFMIYDSSHPESSHFAFSFRNGETLTLLVDKPEYDNPEQKHWRRNPGRDMERRVFRMRFPYQLLDIQWDEKGHLYVPRSNGLVKYQVEAVKMWEIKDLPADQIIWVIMMFDLIVEQYWKSNFKAKELAYTGEMLHYPNALPESSALQKLSNYKTIEVEKLDVGDVKEGQINFGCKSPQSNLWMEERYGNQVNPEIFNVLQEEGKPKELLMDKAGTISNLTEKREWGKLEVECKTIALSPTHYGTRDRLVRDYKWIARRNLAIAVGELAKKEFEETEEKVKAEYFAKVKANVENLKKAVVEGKLKSTYIGYDSNNSFTIGGGRIEMKGNILHRNDEKNKSIFGRFRTWSDFILSGGTHPTTRWKFLCIDRGVTATHCVQFGVSTAAAMAAVCGCKVEELPPVLQHFRTEDPYHGNSILNDVDPMEWMPKNPWRKIHWDVYLFFSANAEKEWKKKYGNQR